MRAIHRFLLIIVIGRGAGAFVESHDDVRADSVLDFDGALGCEAVHGAVVMRSEGHAFLIDNAKLAVALRQSL